MKVPVSNSAEYFQKRAPLEDVDGFRGSTEPPFCYKFSAGMT